MIDPHPHAVREPREPDALRLEPTRDNGGHAPQECEDLERHFEELLEERLAERTRALAASAESARRANLAKGVVLANISHEIRSPLNAIVGFADTLADPRIPESARAEATAIVRRNARHLMEVINDVLDFSRIEAGRLEVERVPCAVGPLVAEVASLMGPRIQAKGLQFDADYEGLVPATIETDPVRLRQILLTLLGHALDCTARGSVSLRVSQLERGFNPQSPQDASILFRISDTGPGLTGEQLAGLFEPYAGRDAMLVGSGSGLGFAVARELARSLGGELTARSMAGGGSVFELVVAAGSMEGVELEEGLPTELASTAGEDDAGGAAKWLAGMRILVAEDQPESQILMTYLLGEPGAGAELEIAPNGQDAVDRALEAWRAGTPYDVIVMDMQMPVLDGYGATSRLRSYGYDRPIIALTAHALPSDRARCLDAGCDEYLAKPVDRRRLLQTLSQYGRGAVAINWRAADAPAAAAAGATEAGPTESEPVNLPALLERCMGDRALAARLLASLAQRGGEEIERVARAVAQRDGDAAARMLHAFKGGCAYLSAVSLVRCAAAVEETLPGDSAAATERALASLRGEWARFRDYSAGFQAH